jgi:predicted nuclease with TOPRIM domain
MAITLTSSSGDVKRVEEALALGSSAKDSKSSSSPTPEGGVEGKKSDNDQDLVTSTSAPESGDGSGPSGKDDETGEQPESQATGDTQEAKEGSESSEGKESESDGEQEKIDVAAHTRAKPKSGIEKRIDRLTAEKRSLEAELQRQHGESLRMSARLADLEKASKVQDTKDKSDGKDVQPLRARPSFDSGKYDSYEAFLEDSSKWIEEAHQHARTSAQREMAIELDKRVNEAIGKLEQRQTEQVRRVQAEKIRADFNSRTDEGRKLYSDYDDVVINNDTIQLSDIQRRLFVTHPKGHLLGYWFGSNPEGTARIAVLPEQEQLLELGMVIASLGKANGVTGKTGTAPATSSTIRPSKAAKPPKPVGAKTTGAVKTYDHYEKASYRDYVQARRAGNLK